MTYSSSDKTVKIWNAGSRQCVHTFYDHSDQVSVWRQKEETPLSLSLSLTKWIVFLFYITVKSGSSTIFLCSVLYHIICSTLIKSLCSVLHCVLYSYYVLMLCSTVYEPLFQCPYFLFYRICSILTVYFCLIPHCLFFSYSILMFFHSVVSTLSVSLCFVPYCMFYFNIELMFVPQVWSAKYNSAGSKIVSVSDDRAVHIYDCPPVWCHHHCYIINSFIIKLAIC